MAEKEDGEELEVEIREATAMDGRDIARIQIETWRASYAGILPKEYLIDLSLEERGAWWRETVGRKREGETFVAALPPQAGPPGARGGISPGGPIVGFGSCGRARSSSSTAQGEVYTLYVDLDWQNQGIGRRLLTRLFEELVAQGCSSALIRVLAANPSRYFYEAMGGEAVGEGQEHFAGVKLAVLAYGWRDLQEWLARWQRQM